MGWLTCNGQEVEASEFVSLESLASLVARIALRHAIRPDDIVTVRAAKPKALVFAEAAEVEIVRTSRDYPAATRVEASTPGSHALGLDPPVGPSALNLLSQNVILDPSSPSTCSPLGQHFAAIALGSNLGDRFANIEAALRLLDQPSPNITVINTSFLYETAPMYVTDQPSFLNCACIVRSFELCVANSHPQCSRLEPMLHHSRSWRSSRSSSVPWGAYLQFAMVHEPSTWMFCSTTMRLSTPDPNPSEGLWKISRVI